MAADLRGMSAEDPVFWMITFLWTYDPRKQPAGLPFILWPFQQEAVSKILTNMGVIGNRPRDLFVEKSRDMGASWVCLATGLWAWDHLDGLSGMLMSRKEDLVDKPGDPDSLFWKIDYMLDQMPDRMRPRYVRQKLHLENLHNGSVIDGISTSADSCRGGRRRFIFLDEFAAVENGAEILSATADASPCRIFATTPKGTANAAYKLRCQPGMDKLAMHWTLHPEKSAGLYKDPDGKPRSPWYDAECSRRASRIEIAQELDLDWLTSGGTFFDRKEIDKHIADNGVTPTLVGTLEYDALAMDPRRFVPEAKGKLALWFDPDAAELCGRPDHTSAYVMGIDVSAGTGGKGSASVCSVWRVRDRAKVARYMTSFRRPDDFARDCMALGKWFAGGGRKAAFMLYEVNGGPGVQFGQTVVGNNYPFVYYQENDRSVARERSMNPGWFSNRERKEALLGEYRRELARGSVKNPSLSGLEECMSYVYLKNGGIGLPVDTTQKTPAEEETSRHGDEVMADALGVRALREWKPESEEEEALQNENTFAYRQAMRRERSRKVLLW